MTGVRNIPDISNLVAEVHEVSVQDIKCDERAGMPKMTLPTHGGSANV